MTPAGEVFDHYDYPGPGWIGSAHSISGDASEPDVIERLHDVVEEITGTRPGATVRRMGFV